MQGLTLANFTAFWFAGPASGQVVYSPQRWFMAGAGQERQRMHILDSTILTSASALQFYIYWYVWVLGLGGQAGVGVRVSTWVNSQDNALGTTQ